MLCWNFTYLFDKIKYINTWGIAKCGRKLIEIQIIQLMKTVKLEMIKQNILKTRLQIKEMGI